MDYAKNTEQMNKLYKITIISNIIMILVYVFILIYIYIYDKKHKINDESLHGRVIYVIIIAHIMTLSFTVYKTFLSYNYTKINKLN